MNKTYNHKEIEPKIYDLWEEGGYFTPKTDPAKKSYTIVLPPPNSNGKLHVGHALMIAIEDLLIRWKRMQGYSALWVPGTDHAGFETQSVFEKNLKKEGKSRMDYDRKTLYNMVYDFVREQGDVIYAQVRSLGPSLDWSRKKFTLDDDVIQTVHKTFKKMHADELVYRGEYMVNYCTHCGTTLSDLEIEYTDKNTPLYYIDYVLLDSHSNEPEFVQVATTRPEPIYVDTHLAVNPDDESKKWLIGRQLENPLTGASMTIIADSFVDPEFGTGVVKLTPAHDKNDYEAAKRHKLPLMTAVGVDGKMINSPTELGFDGLYAKQARAKAVEILIAKGLLKKENINEKYQHSVATCYKCKNQIENLILPNWFVRVDHPEKSLKQPALNVVKNGEVKIYPEWQETKYHRWMEEMHDWPISRQIVWGIRIPVWYNVQGHESLVTLSFVAKDGRQLNGSLEDLLKEFPFDEIKSGLQQLRVPLWEKSEDEILYEISDKEPETPGRWLPETDTFDTWFSSGHWPLVTLGYPDSADFNYFYPTAVLETGWEILRFWVSRMIMFGIYLTGKPPFSDVYLHGLVRASDGRKMSKSLGNQVDPLDYVSEFGADALRMGLISGTAGGKDFAFPHDKVLGYRNFANKIWNMARFMGLMEESYQKDTGNTLCSFNGLDTDSLKDIDREMLSKMNSLIISTNENLEKYRFAQAGEDIYHFMWDDMASSYIENVKNREDKQVALPVLRHLYLTSLKLLHPFMPFVTEEIWLNLLPNEKPLIISEWPGARD